MIAFALIFAGLVVACCASTIKRNNFQSHRRQEASNQTCDEGLYLDAERVMCLILCGPFHQLRCKVDEYCQPSRLPFGEVEYRCVSYCASKCETHEFCDVNTGKCEPCFHICTPYHRQHYPDCRINCYDMIKISVISKAIVTSALTTKVASTQAGPSTYHWGMVAGPIVMVIILTLLSILGWRISRRCKCPLQTGKDPSAAELHELRRYSTDNCPPNTTCTGNEHGSH